MSIVGLLLLCLLLVLYFVPAAIAYARDHRNFAGVLLLNIFLGWTLVGYVMALIWSLWVSKD